MNIRELETAKPFSGINRVDAFPWRAIHNFAVAASAAIILAGCASSHMRPHVGQDIRAVMTENGPLVNAFDMGDGRRAFQFMWGGTQVGIARVATPNASAISNNQALTSNAPLQASGAIIGTGCLFTYIADWNSGRSGWIVTEFKFPNQLVC